MKNCVRQEDTVARLGGDEFTVILPCIKFHEDAVIVANKIIEEIRRTFLVDGYEINTSTSIGVSVFPTDGVNAEKLMMNADTAMYSAKASGRNTYAFYNPVMAQSVLAQ